MLVIMKANIFLSLIIVLSGVLFNSCTKPGDATVEQGVTAFGAGRYDDAKQFFEQSLEMETRFSKEMIYNFLANTCAAQEDYENSTKWLEKSLETKADYRGYVTLGMNYQSLKNYEKAEESYRKAISMNEAKGEAWASLGMMYLEQNLKLSQALDCLKKGAEYSPKIAVIQAYLGAAYFLNGEKQKAEECLQKAEELKCENLELIKEKFGMSEIF